MAIHDMHDVKDSDTSVVIKIEKCIIFIIPLTHIPHRRNFADISIVHHIIAVKIINTRGRYFYVTDFNLTARG